MYEFCVSCTFLFLAFPSLFFLSIVHQDCYSSWKYKSRKTRKPENYDSSESKAKFPKIY